MITNLNDPRHFFFSFQHTIVIEHSRKIVLLGKVLGAKEELNIVDAFLFHHIRETKSYIKIPELYRLAKLKFSDVIFLKSLNKLLEIGVIQESENLNIPKYVLKYKFENSILSAETFENYAAHSWVLLLDHQLKNDSEILNDGLFFGRIFNSKQSLVDELRVRIADLNEILAKYTNEKNFVLGESDDNIENFDNELLWKVHKYFEVYTKDFIAKSDIPNDEKESVIKKLKLLNYNIHIAEDHLSGWDGGSVDVIFTSVAKPALIGPFDDLFSPDLLENHIYLNYYHIGYSLQAAFDVGTTSKPVPQEHFSANHFIYLRPSAYLDEERRVRMAKWAKDVHDIDLESPETRLGHIPLAKIQTSLTYKELANNLAKDQKLKMISIETL